MRVRINSRIKRCLSFNTQHSICVLHTSCSPAAVVRLRLCWVCCSTTKTLTLKTPSTTSAWYNAASDRRMQPRNRRSRSGSTPLSVKGSKPVVRSSQVKDNMCWAVQIGLLLTGKKLGVVINSTAQQASTVMGCRRQLSITVCVFENTPTAPPPLALATARIALAAAVGVTTSSNRLMVIMLSLPCRARGDASCSMPTTGNTTYSSSKHAASSTSHISM